MKKSDGLADQPQKDAAIQVICLGAGGGPNEDSVTGLLVRAMASKWSKNSVLAVDAGTHLSAITRILEQDFPAVVHTSPAAMRVRFEGSDDTPSPTDTASQHDGSSDGSSDDSWRSASPQPNITTLTSGAFAGLPFPYASARANAVHVVREHVSTYLITHPHLDHLSGFVINTAAFHNTSKPKRLAALPGTVNSIKTHIFNDVIWPNLTDEDGGVGLVTFQRLAEGGNIALGEGLGRGYIEVCDGLGVKGFKVSHGNCMKGPGHIHRGSNAQLGDAGPTGLSLPIATGDGRSLSISAPSQPGTPLFTGLSGASVPPMDTTQQCVVDSSAYFIRAESGIQYSSSSRPPPAREILIFGDVEPDSLSLTPRTAHIWGEAAPKIAAGVLKGIFIECSYTDSRGDAILFGHLAPRHLIQELQCLADLVKEARKEHEREREEHRKGRKRKRASAGSINGFLSGADDDYGRRRSRSRRALTPAATSAPTSAATTTTVEYTKATGRHSVPLLSPGEKVMRDFLDTPTSTANVTPTSDPETPAQDPPPIPVPVPVTGNAPGQQQQQYPPSVSVASGYHRASAPAILEPTSLVPAKTTARALSAAGEHHAAPPPPPLPAPSPGPLKGLKVVVIHVKDMDVDGPVAGECILEELEEHERRLADAGKPLGCEFVVSRHGGSYWF